MGRQKGQSKRTKGNLQPSNSRRAAAFLSETQGITGFESLSGNLGYVPILKSLEEDTNALVDPHFRVILSKLTKKDVRTKLKALNEFSEYCQNCETEQVITILPYWPRIYNKLCKANDRRVREVSHVAFKFLLIKVGKEIAPHLKNIMGLWWISRCDAFSPASMSANSAFVEAFPSEEKQIKVALFCYHEILSSIYSFVFMNAKAQPALSAGDQSSLSPTDREVHDERMIASSLFGLALFVNVLKLNKNNAVPDINADLGKFLENQKFWKLSKHKSPSIRAAFYSTLSAMCVSNPELLKDHILYICKCVLSKLDDPHYQVCKEIWVASNNLTVAFPEWHNHVDIRKGFLPQLWNALKSGFHGNARIASPHVLPLIKQFPSSLAVLPIYQELFKCLQQGLEQEITRKSSGETKAIVTVIVECMQFVLQRTVETCDVPDWEIIDFVIDKQLFSLLENSVQQKTYLTASLHQLIVSTLQLFSNNSSPTTSESYHKICEMIWEKFFLIGKTILTDFQGNEKGPEIVRSLLGFFKIAKTNSFNDRQNLKLNVHFEEAEIKAQKADKLPTKNEYKSKEYDEKLNCIVKNLILTIFEVDLSKANKVVLLHQFLSLFSSFELIDSVVKDRHGGNHTGDVALFFIENDVVPLIKSLNASDQADQQVNDLVPNLLYLCLKFCTKDAQHFLDDLLSNPSNYNVNIKTSMQLGQLVVDGAITKYFWYEEWLKSKESSFGKFLEQLIEDNIESYAYTQLLQITMTSKCYDNVNQILHQDTVLRLIKELEKISPTLDPGYLVKISSICFSAFSNYSSDTSFVKESKPVLMRLLTHLLTVVSDMEVGLDGLQQILCILLSNEEAVMEVQDMMMNCADTLRTILLSSVSFNINLVTTFLTELLDQSLDFVVQWFNAFIPDPQSWLCYRPSIIAPTWFDTTTVVNCDVICFDNKVLSCDHEAKPEYLNISVCLTQLISSIENLVSSSNPEVLSQLLDLDKVEVLFLEYYLAKANSAEKASTKSDMWYLSYTHFIEKLGLNICRQSSKIGHGWCLCFNELLKDTGIEPISTMFLKEFSTTETILTEPLCNTIAIFIKFCNDPEILEKLSVWITDKIVDCQSQFREKLDSLKSGDFKNYSLCLFLLSKLLAKSSLLEVDDLLVTCIEVVRNLLELRNSSASNVFLFDVELSTSDNTTILFNVFVVKFLQSVLLFDPHAFEKEGWDFMEICLVSFLESLSSTASINWQQLTLLNATCSLMANLSDYLTSTEAINDPLLPSSLTSEWKEFFGPSAHSELVYIFIQLRDHSHSDMDIILPVFKKCFTAIRSETLLSAATRLTPYLVPDSEISDSIQTLIYNFSVMLVPGSNGSSERQVIAFNLLEKIQEVVFKKDGSEDHIHEIRVPLKLKDIVQLLTSAMDEILIFVPEKKPCVKNQTSDADSQSEEEFDSDEYQSIVSTPLSPVHEHIPTSENIGAAIGYLFAWRLIIGLLEYIPSNRRSIYISIFNDASFLSIHNTLLPKLVKLLPKIPMFFKTVEGKSKKCNMFETILDFDGANADFSNVQHLACLLYGDLLKNVPAIVRTWFNNLSKLSRAEIDDYTSAYVTPGLCKRELNTVSQASRSKELTVKARPSTREVVATYEVSDADFEISVHLSLNHPLSPVQVNTIRRIGVAASQWRYWILQMTMLLQHQNGSILDALLLWKEKVDKRLDGLEECMICFSVVHGSNTQSLPKLECKTCHKKYHAECLYKWFDTSNQSTCPLCRTPMMFK